MDRRQLLGGFGALAIGAVASADQSRGGDSRPTPRKVLRIDIDDVNREDFDEWRGLGLLPFLDSFIPLGVDMPNFWAAPWCSLFRARVLTGCDAYRLGNLVGRNTDAADPFPGPAGPWIGEGMQGYRLKIGKWHTGGLASFPGCLLKGFDEGAVLTHSQLDWLDVNHPEMGYYNWPEFNVDAASSSGPVMNTSFATNVLAARVTQALNDDVDYIDASFHAVHIPLDETPPADEPPGAVYVGGSTLEARAREYLHHLDWRLSQIIPLALQRGYVVFLAGDNGSAGGFGKGTFKERGLRTPCFAWGPGIRAGLRTELISATDFWATIRALRGASLAVGGEDSVSFAHLLYPNEFSGSARTYLTCDEFPKVGAQPDKNEWTRAIRNHRWKLIVEKHPGSPAKEKLYDLQTDRGEYADLMFGTLTPQQQQAHDRLFAALPTLP